MAVCIRLSRVGRIHRPFFRIVAIDKRNAREGLSNEVLGTYDPTLADGKAIAVKSDRVEAWLAKGALISEALDNLFKHHGVAINRPAYAKAKKAAAKPAKAKKAAKKDGKKFVPATRRAVRKHAAKLKADRKAKAAAEAAAAKPAEAAAEAPKA
ncbi:MAG: 30S ribosomal protein S16 [Planctomycetes bacterium]|nr:30S ribosomal protein S16 [Planctomycetota bacterium]